MRGDTLRFQFWRATMSPSRGLLATLRVPTVALGLSNPPTLVGATLAAPAATGDAVVSIAATSAFGRLAAGDILLIGTDGPAVAADVASAPIVGSPQGFFNVPLSNALLSDYPQGQAVVVDYQADTLFYAVIAAYPERLIDGSLIRTEDLRITAATLDSDGNDLPRPLAGNLIAVGGDMRTIINVLPNYAGNTVVSYTMQAR